MGLSRRKSLRRRLCVVDFDYRTSTSVLVMPTQDGRRSTLGQWWGRTAAILLLLHAQASAHLSKEFTSANREAARSIEPERAGNNEDYSSFDMGAILCEKYGEWSKWSPCSRKCEQTRVRGCKVPEECGKSWVKEKKTCTREKGECSPLSYKVIGIQKRNRLIEELLYDLLYAPWTSWGPCLRSCRQRRQRKCKYKAICIRSYIQEERRCQVDGSECEHRFNLKPMGLSRENATSSTTTLSHQQDWVTLGSDQPEDIGDEDYYDAVPEGGDAETGEGQQSPLIVDDNDGDDHADDVDDGGGGSLASRAEAVKAEPWLSSRRQDEAQNKKKERKGLTFGSEMTSAQKKCGIRPRLTSGNYRVVGGQEVQKNSWPWQVAILTKYREQYCGGTLIAPRWVLTAAHCIQKKGKRRKLIVRIGEHDIDEFDPTQEDIRSEQEFPHPDFDYHTITNDIALIKLQHPPSAFTQPGFACLPQADYTPPKDQLCTIVGWGKLKNTHVYGSSSLQEVQVPVVRQRKCERVFDYAITSKQVCAGYKNGGKDSCAGDSGGPLLCGWKYGDVDRYVIYGVTSYGEGCGRKQKYGIYTKVASYRDWIDKTISENT